ncbi:MAG: Nif3-like dinuclear metal center hexameric protein [Lentisphaeria bacterium]|nr:Nif3-like dinuclear metal center hexameric protein [Lentisphaeria bacterium]
MKRDELVSYLNKRLNLSAFAGDVSNNGLQVEGADEVSKIIVGVDGCMELFQRAVDENAPFIIVHHGISWGSEPRRFSGITAKRLKLLFQHNISLYACHLPLDAHPELGNNAQLCGEAGIIDKVPCCNYHGLNIGFAGNFAGPLTLKELAERLGGAHTMLGDPARLLKSAAVVSGGGGNDALDDAVSRNADVLITGELSHEMFHSAQENDIAVLALGHYASETRGVRAVLKDLQNNFDLPGSFADIPTGL